MADVAPGFSPSVPDSWFLDASPSRQSSGSLTQALRLQGCLNLAALRNSVESLIARCQSLWNLPGWNPPGETPAASSHLLPSYDVLPNYDALPISDFTAL